jgi:hypothetical protein
MKGEIVSHIDFLYSAKELLIEPKYSYAGSEGRNNVEPDKQNTLEHEAYHAYMLTMAGAMHGKIESENTATKKGSTEITRGTHPRAIVLGAAGGAVDTTEGKSSGTSHDEHVADAQNIMPWSQAVGIARDYIQPIDTRERRKWGQILHANNGKLGAGEIMDVVLQAREEVHREDVLPEQRKQLWRQFEGMNKREQELARKKGGIIFDATRREIALAA